MRERDRFKSLRKRRAIFSLNFRFIITLAIVVLASIMLSFLIVMLFEYLFPYFGAVPYILRIVVFSVIISFSTTPVLLRWFFAPVQEVRSGMQRVAAGDFNVHLDCTSSFTELQELVVGFNMMVQELQSTEILQSDFVSNVSHEFKTPINAIEGYATLLQGSENSPEAVAGYTEKILFNTRRLSSLVSNVLLLSKIENQSLGDKVEKFNISEQIREAIVALEPAWEKKNIEFDVELVEAEYTGPKSMMHHVWSNLIGNAIKFSPDGGEITIRLTKNDNQFVFTISDRGPGISEEAKNHIFDKFYQENTSHEGEGNGLGLALVKRIITATGGEISVENREGGGCTFYIFLTENEK